MGIQSASIGMVLNKRTRFSAQARRFFRNPGRHTTSQEELQSEVVKNALKQLPRPVMLQRDDTSITMTLYRKGQANESMVGDSACFLVAFCKNWLVTRESYNMRCF